MQPDWKASTFAPQIGDKGSYAPSQIQELCTPNWSSLETGQRALNFFDLLK